MQFTQPFTGVTQVCVFAGYRIGVLDPEARRRPHAVDQGQQGHVHAAPQEGRTSHLRFVYVICLLFTNVICLPVVC